MTRFDLWVLDPITGEMDRRIVTDIDDFDEAEERAQDEADNRDRVILVLMDDEGTFFVFPDERRWES